MGLFGHVVGGAVFGLTARFWQLGILRKPMLTNPTGHAVCTVAFAGAGYYWWRATEYMQGVLAEKEHELRIKRQSRQMQGEAVLEAELNRSKAEPQSL
ncbi:hypothetical protein DFH06DRAFT_1165274 [Mycena polygramma]|nr:hypothetical protein DFH06DRAFT_1165274 [Mycena polygramma]